MFGTPPRLFPHVFPASGHEADADSSGANNNSTLHIPVCHLYRADLALRPEFAAVLRDVDVKGEDVFTLEDVLPPHHHHHGGGGNPPTSNGAAKEEDDIIIHPEDTRWLLVDHNAMTGALGRVFDPASSGASTTTPTKTPCPATPRSASSRRAGAA